MVSLIEFLGKLEKFKETSNDKDGYSEKLFDGLRQAIRDMAACNKRTKLLFVISDHGDNQKDVPQDIIDSLNHNFTKKLVFFNAE